MSDPCYAFPPSVRFGSAPDVPVPGRWPVSAGDHAPVNRHPAGQHRHPSAAPPPGLGPGPGSTPAVVRRPPAAIYGPPGQPTQPGGANSRHPPPESYASPEGASHALPTSSATQASFASGPGLKRRPEPRARTTVQRARHARGDCLHTHADAYIAAGILAPLSDDK